MEETKMNIETELIKLGTTPMAVVVYQDGTFKAIVRIASIEIEVGGDFFKNGKQIKLK